MTTTHSQQKEKHTTLNTQLTASEELLQTLLTGLSTANASSAGGYLGQLADAKAALGIASTEEEQARMKMGMVDKELKEKAVKWKAVEKEIGDGTRSLEKGKKEVEALRKRLEQTGWDAEKDEAAALRARQAREDVRTLTEVSGCYTSLTGPNA